MRRFPTFILVGFAIAALCAGIIALVTFHDVRADGTMRSEVGLLFGARYTEGKPVPRKDFALALAKLKKIKIVKSTSCFSDLKTTDPTSPAICTLKKINLFKGITGAFKPAKIVDMHFALTTLCRNYLWTEGGTYLTCASYAKKHKILDEEDARTLQRSAPLTYDRLAEMMTRAEALDKKIKEKPLRTAAPSPTPPPPAIPPEEITHTATFTPVEDTTISATFFSKIQLNNPLPSRFYQNEVYFVEGDIVEGTTAKEAFVFICSMQENCDKSINFIEKTKDNHFSIPIFFREAGNYKIGIIPGRSGESRVTNISVLPTAPQSSGGTTPMRLSTLYKEGKSFFAWDGAGSFTRLTIFQETLRKDYLFRQEVNSFAPPAEDFSGFRADDAFWVVTRGSAQSALQKAHFTMHNFRKIDQTALTVHELQETMSTPGNLIFKATALGAISKRAAMTLPDGTVKELSVGTSDVAEGKDFTIQTNLPVAGTYIFEVNNPQGSAVVNIPVYVGDVVPLIPDFFDLAPAELDPTPLKDLTAARITVLALINSDRATMHLPPVTLADDLNAVAQAHTQDMLTRKFFGHVNPSGESPDDRRKKAGITTAIRENLGKAASLELIEAGLMRSPIHREALIEPTVTRVGIGVGKSSEGYFYLTQNFAGPVLTAQDLTTLEQSILSAGNKTRTTKGLAVLEVDTTIKSIAATWSARMAKEGFFGTTDPQGVSIVEITRKAGINSALQIHMVEASTSTQLTDAVLAQDSLTQAAQKKIAISIGMDITGNLLMTVIYMVE